MLFPTKERFLNIFNPRSRRSGFLIAIHSILLFVNNLFNIHL